MAEQLSFYPDLIRDAKWEFPSTRVHHAGRSTLATKTLKLVVLNFWNQEPEVDEVYIVPGTWLG